MGLCISQKIIYNVPKISDFPDEVLVWLANGSIERATNENIMMGIIGLKVTYLNKGFCYFTENFPNLNEGYNNIEKINYRKISFNSFGGTLIEIYKYGAKYFHIWENGETRITNLFYF